MQTPVTGENERKKAPQLFRLIRRTVLRVSPKYTLCGTDRLPGKPCVIVGNHCQMYGPLAAELYMPRPAFTWCVGEMMNRKEVPAYAFQDFWSKKPRRVQWFYRLLSHCIAPLAEYIFTRAHTIPVYRDARVMTTFRLSLERLRGGADLVIFPEKAELFNRILCRFQEHFVDIARLAWRKSGTVLTFVPMYIAPRLGSIHFGDPVRFDPEAPEEEERQRVCSALSSAITDLAEALPPHVVIPYLNIPKSQYPLSRDADPGKGPALRQ